MKKISLEKAFSLLQSCKAVIIDGDHLCYPALDEVIGESDNEFMYLKYEEDGDCCMKFVEENNQEITLVDSTLLLEDNEGDELELTLLFEKDLEQEIEVDIICERKDVQEDTFDEAVHEVSSCIASKINNGGVRSQVNFLIEQGFDPEQILENLD